LAGIGLALAACGGVAMVDGGDAGPQVGTVGTPGAGAYVTPQAAAAGFAEVPAPTLRFLWGRVAVTAPGFVGPPEDTLTIALDDANRLRFINFSTLPALGRGFGDRPDEFPLSGYKHVVSESEPSYDVTVEQASSSPNGAFSARYHVVGNRSDFVEAVQGAQTGDQWAVTFSRVGTFWGVAMNAEASGTIADHDPQATAPQAGQATWWEAPVELAAPGFVGPPADHLRLYVQADGQPGSLVFERFVHDQYFFGDEDRKSVV
jgi:hypothetical protein